MVSPSNWEQIRALFHRALERAPDERAAFVRAESSDDDVVREVASLLAAHADADADALLEPAGPREANRSPARVGQARRGPLPVTLPAGARLGPYTVVSPLGAGAMGEVYLARDSNLRRDVALKILPESLAADPDRLARFTREARTLGALNHPHIAQVHGFEEHDGVRALVMELVEGQDLAQSVARGPIAVKEALRIARQIAEALEAAHARGIVHRDLKPANIMIRADGAVKVLDFGLAKAWTDDLGSAAAPADLGGVPATMTTPPIATEVGVLVGTAAYMSPEQARGGVVDRGSDIWAFGCVLYEMLTGARAFPGAGVVDTLAHVVQRDPAWDNLPHTTPPAIRVLLRRCLRKERRERLQDAAGVRIEIDDVLHDGEGNAQTVSPRARDGLTSRLPWAIAAFFGVAALTLLLFRQASLPVSPTPLRFRVVLDDVRLQQYDVPELSPDGRRIAYAALRNGRRELFVNDLRTEQTVVLPGTGGAGFPFWAPDGRTLAFFAEGSLKRVALTGGAAHVLAPAPDGTGGAWKPGTILFAPNWEGVFQQLGDTGGTPSPVRTDATTSGHGFVSTPSFLPDGVHFIVANLAGRGVYVASLDAPQVRRLIEVDTGAARFAAGYLLYLQGRRLMARPLNPTRLEFSGPEIKVAEPAGPFSAVGTGTVAYAEPPPLPRLTWVTREGAATVLPAAAADFIGLGMSPSGRRAAVWSRDDGGNVDLWEVDLSSGDLSRLTTQPGPDSDVVWSPDERRVAFTSGRLGRWAVFVKDLASRAETVVHAPPDHVVVDAWTPDGRQLVVRAISGPGFLVSVDGDRTARRFLDTPYAEDELTVSPDGRWIAFHSDESGSWEVYVAAFPDFRVRRQVSRGGGVQPHWRGDGQELFFLDARGAVMSARVSTSPSLHTTTPVRLFAANIDPSPDVAQYAVTPDGQRFLVLDRGARRPDTVHVLLHWLNTAALAGQ